VDRPVSDEELRLVAGAEDERMLARRIIVKNGHPLPGHLVSAPDAAVRGAALEIGVDHRGDVDGLGPDAQPIGHDPGIVLVRVEALSVRQAQAEDVAGSQGPGRHAAQTGGVQSAGEPQDALLEAEFGQLSADEFRQDADGERTVIVMAQRILCSEFNVTSACRPVSRARSGGPCGRRPVQLAKRRASSK